MTTIVASEKIKMIITYFYSIVIIVVIIIFTTQLLTSTFHGITTIISKFIPITITIVASLSKHGHIYLIATGPLKIYSGQLYTILNYGYS